MKKILLYSALAATVAFTACDDKFTEHEFLDAATVSASVSEVTAFDTSFDVDLSVSNSGVSELLVTGGANVNEVVAITDLMGTLPLTSASFGDAWVIGSAASFETTVDYGSHQSKVGFSIDVVEAIMAEAGESVAEYDSTKCFIDFSGATMFQDLGMVKVEKRRVVGGDFENTAWETIVDEAAGMEYAYADSIVGVDFDITDTIEYKITATSGSYSESQMVSIAVKSKSLGAATAAMLSAASDSIEFMPEAGILSFVSTETTAGFVSADTEFVKVTVGEGGDVEELAELYEFSTLVGVVDGGTKVSSVNDAKIGDLYAFTYMYGDGSYYGLITVEDVVVSVTGADAKVGFSYSQEVKY